MANLFLRNIEAWSGETAQWIKHLKVRVWIPRAHSKVWGAWQPACDPTKGTQKQGIKSCLGKTKKTGELWFQPRDPDSVQ